MNAISTIIAAGKRRQQEIEKQEADERSRRRTEREYNEARENLHKFTDPTSGAKAFVRLVSTAKALGVEFKIVRLVELLRSQDRDGHQCLAALLQMSLDGAKQWKIANELKAVFADAIVLDRVRTLCFDILAFLSPYNGEGTIASPDDERIAAAKALAEQEQRRAAVPEAVPADSTSLADATVDDVQPRPCYDRDHKWLEWYEDKNADTYHSHATIRDRWNRENPEYKISKGAGGRDIVNKAITKAKRERGGA